MIVAFCDRVEAPKHVRVCVLEQESVLLNLQAEFYFGLDEIGTRFWQVLATSSSVETAYQQLLTEFDVPEERLRNDVSKLIENLLDKGLLRIYSAGTAKTLGIPCAPPTYNRRFPLPG